MLQDINTVHFVQMFLSPPIPLSVPQEYASPALVQNKLEEARIVPAFLVTANQRDVYDVS